MEIKNVILTELILNNNLIYLSQIFKDIKNNKPSLIRNDCVLYKLRTRLR